MHNPNTCPSEVSVHFVPCSSISEAWPEEAKLTEEIKKTCQCYETHLVIPAGQDTETGAAQVAKLAWET